MTEAILSEVWCREEIDVMLALIVDAIRKLPANETGGMVGLGHLHLKLTKARETAPNGMTKVGAV